MSTWRMVRWIYCEFEGVGFELGRNLDILFTGLYAQNWKVVLAIIRMDNRCCEIRNLGDGVSSTK